MLNNGWLLKMGKGQRHAAQGERDAQTKRHRFLPHSYPRLATRSPPLFRAQKFHGRRHVLFPVPGSDGFLKSLQRRLRRGEVQ